MIILKGWYDFWYINGKIELNHFWKYYIGLKVTAIVNLLKMENYFGVVDVARWMKFPYC